MGAAESEIKAIARALELRFHNIEAYPSTVTVNECEELRRQINSIEYFLRYGDRRGIQVDQRDHTLVAYRCSVQGCNNKMPYFNLAQDGSFHFVCIDHIPPDVNFPIGLWGADWERSGRKPVKPTVGGG